MAKQKGGARGQGSRKEPDGEEGKGQLQSIIDRATQERLVSGEEQMDEK